jgi:hypothetical protein
MPADASPMSGQLHPITQYPITRSSEVEHRIRAG